MLSLGSPNYENSLNMFKLLVEYGANIFAVNSQKQNLVPLAEWYKNKQIVEFLLDNYEFDIMA